jgi:hypothetical protein
MDLTNNSGHLEDGRVLTSPRRSLLIRKKERIENQLAAIDARGREQKRKRDTRMKVIVGAAVLAHARLDPDFAAKLHDVLLRAVVRPADRAFLLNETNAWRSVEAQLTLARNSKREAVERPPEPVLVERKSYLKKVARYEELKQI